MKRILMLTAALACSPAYAGGDKADPMPAASASTATSSAMSTARSASTSRASVASSNRVTVNNAFAAPSGSGSTTRVSSAPDVIPPAIVGGNPCTVGISIGGGGLNGGGGAGLSWESHECSLRQAAAILANLGLTRAAIETLCRTNNDERWALRNAGWYCKDDVDNWIREGYRQGADGAWRKVAR